MIEGAIWQLHDEELLAALRDLETQQRRLYGHMLELLGELQTRTVGEHTQYRSLPHLLQDLLRISRKEATRRLVHAQAVTPVRMMSGPRLPPPLPAMAEAVRDGVLGVEHLDTIHRTLSTLPPSVTPEEREC